MDIETDEEVTSALCADMTEDTERSAAADNASGESATSVDYD